jgi:hypothetical protein
MLMGVLVSFWWAPCVVSINAAAPATTPAGCSRSTVVVGRTCTLFEAAASAAVLLNFARFLRCWLCLFVLPVKANRR